MSELSNECPKAKIKRLQSELEAQEVRSAEAAHEVVKEVSETFQGAIEYMAGQCEMMETVLKKLSVNQWELKVTRTLVFACAAAVLAVEFLK
jgi:hypothetical protein